MARNSAENKKVAEEANVANVADEAADEVVEPTEAGATTDEAEEVGSGVESGVESGVDIDEVDEDAQAEAEADEAEDEAAEEEEPEEEDEEDEARQYAPVDHKATALRAIGSLQVILNNLENRESLLAAKSNGSDGSEREREKLEEKKSATMRVFDLIVERTSGLTREEAEVALAGAEA